MTKVNRMKRNVDKSLKGNMEETDQFNKILCEILRKFTRLCSQTHSALKGVTKVLKFVLELVIFFARK